MAHSRFGRHAVLIGAAVAALVGLIGLWLCPPGYTASALVRVRQTAAGLGSPDEEPSASRDSVLDQIASSDRIGREVDELGLDAQGRGVHPGGADQAGRPALIARVQAAVRLYPAGTPGDWRVTYSTRDRPLAATVLNDLISRAATGPSPATERGRDPRLGVLTAARDDALATVRTVQEVQASDVARDAVITDQARKIDLQLRALRPGQDGSPAASTADDLPALLAQRAQLAGAQATLAQRYGPRYPAVVALEQKMQALAARVDDATRLGAVQARASGDAAAWIASLKDLRRGAESLLEQDAQQQARLTLLLQRLAAIGSRDQAALDAAQRRFGANRLQIQLLAPASTPPRPDACPARLAAMALVAFAVAAAVAELLRQRLRTRRFETAADLKRRLGRPVAAVIPALASGAGDRAVDAVLDGGDAAFAAVFRDLGRALGLEGPQGSRRMIAVCSAVAAEGKTTTAVCLARSAALLGRKVILVDCDGRRGAASSLFDDGGGAGLVEVLRDGSMLERATVADPVSGLRVMRHSASGAVADLSAEAGMATLLDRLRALYEVVVLDTAPVLALAEARVIAARADEVLLVARWRHTPVRASRLALDMLDKAGAHVRHLALTLAPPT